MSNKHPSCCENRPSCSFADQAGGMQYFQERLFDKLPPERRISFPGEAEIQTVSGREMQILNETPSGITIGERVHSIAFLPPQSLYVATSRVFAKMDSKWEILFAKVIETSGDFVDVFACKETRVVYVLSTHQLMYSDNDGQTWKWLPPPFTSKMKKIAVASNRIAVCNADGSVCFSEDGGQTWHHLPIGRVRDVCIPNNDPDQFFVLGQDGVVRAVVRGPNPQTPTVIDLRFYPASHLIFLDDEFLYAVGDRVVGWNFKSGAQDLIERRGFFSIKWAKRCQQGCFLVGANNGIYLLRNNRLSRHPILMLRKTKIEQVAIECYNNICYVGGPWPFLLETRDWGNRWSVVFLDGFFFLE